MIHCLIRDPQEALSSTNDEPQSVEIKKIKAHHSPNHKKNSNQINSSIPTPKVVQAGFPSPSRDYEEAPLSIDHYTNLSGPSVYMVRAQGNSMQGAGIYSGSLLVVDKAIDPKVGDIVIAYVYGGFTVKRFDGITGGYVFLRAENTHFNNLKAPVNDCEIWGVVTHSLNHMR